MGCGFRAGWSGQQRGRNYASAVVNKSRGRAKEQASALLEESFLQSSALPDSVKFE